MAKSRPGQLHHAPDPETRAGKEYAALQAERQGIRDERRELHETLQGIKEAERRASAALAELDERIKQVTAQKVIWADLETATRERMREVIRGIISAEVTEFRAQVLTACDGVKGVLEKTRVQIMAHEAELLGFTDAEKCLDYIADKILAMIRADLNERLQEPAAGLILEIVQRRFNDGQARG